MPSTFFDKMPCNCRAEESCREDVTALHRFNAILISSSNTPSDAASASELEEGAVRRVDELWR
jgi:hypothetical protein